MNLTIAGATGGIGRLLTARALEAGHRVTVLARDPSATPTGCTVVRADLSDADVTTLVPAMRGADAVLSCLGPTSRAEAGVATAGTERLLEAMAETGVRRVVVVSAGPIGTVPTEHRPHPPRYDPGDGPFVRYVGGPLIKRILRAHYADLATMEELLRDSAFDWTAVRPPRLTDKAGTGRYRWAAERNIRGGTSIPRADVADFMLACLSLPETARHAVSVAT